MVLPKKLSFNEYHSDHYYLFDRSIIFFLVISEWRIANCLGIKTKGWNQAEWAMRMKTRRAA